MNNKTILIVDDDPDIVEMLRFWLGRHGFKTIGADSGKDGLNKALHYKPDLILSDIMMPGMSGYEMLQAIREKTRTAKTPVIIISANVGREEVSQGKALGATDYVTKPISFSSLDAAVLSALGLASTV